MLGVCCVVFSFLLFSLFLHGGAGERESVGDPHYDAARPVRG